MNIIRKLWLKSRWIGNPPFAAGELLRPSSQVKEGLLMGMRLAVLEEQAAAVVADGRLSAVFLPGAYQLEKDKMPPLQADKKYPWLYPAELYFLNMSQTPPESWQPLEPLLTRDPERGLAQLLLTGEYVAQVENAALFMQNMVLERGFTEWPSLHFYINSRLNEAAITLMAHNRTAISRLDKIREKTARFLQKQLNLEMRGCGLAILNMSVEILDVHPQMRRLWQEQNEHLAFNRALSSTIVG